MDCPLSTILASRSGQGAEPMRGLVGLPSLAALTVLLGGFWLVSALLGGPAALAWLAGAAGAGLLEIFLLWLWRGLNRDADGRPRRGLGAANWLTWLRGLLLVVLAGTAALSPAPFAPGRPAAWLPGLLFLAAILLDAFDGALARRLGQVTELGGRLDLRFDALALLLAGVLALRLGAAPPWFLAVGLAYYLFAAGRLLRQSLGKPVHPLPPSRLRRFLAFMAMAVSTALLLPALGPGVKYALALALTVPFGLNFMRDWWLVCRGRDQRVQAGPITSD